MSRVRKNDTDKQMVSRALLVETIDARVIGCAKRATNEKAWALGQITGNGQFRIRRVVWGRTAARAERRPGEQIRRAMVLITGRRQ